MGFFSSLKKTFDPGGLVKQSAQELDRFSQNYIEKLSLSNQLTKGKYNIMNKEKGRRHTADAQAEEDAAAALRDARNKLTPIPDQNLLDQYARRANKKALSRGGRISTILDNTQTDTLG